MTDFALTPAHSAADIAGAHISVRLSSIAGNYRKAVALAGTARAAAVVKADAYGLGLRAIAPALIGAGAEDFVVARIAEGITLRTLAPKVRIFVLDGAVAGNENALIQYRLTPCLNSMEQIANWSRAAQNAGGALEAAVHIDTGMNRLGLSGADVSVLASEPQKYLHGIRVVLWMSHLACSDEADHPMNRMQLERFRAALGKLPAAPASLSASGGIMLGRDFHFDLVRPGICLYGGNPMASGENPFATGVSCSARILQVREAGADESVGYGATYHTKRPSRLAVAAYGYADGLMRTVSNHGYGAIGGVKVPVVGRVSMDLVIFDVTHLTDVPQPGMDAELFGDTVTLEELARASGTISYEILTQLSPRAARIYQEGA